MLAITQPKATSQSSQKKKVTPNILPCKITHSGPIPTASRHWNPQPTSYSPSSPSAVVKNRRKQTQTSYFRGRKLLGTTLPLPAGYEGKLLLKTDTLLPQAPRTQIPSHNQHAEDDEDEDEDEALPEEIKQASQLATFEEVVVWGHESLPGEDDVYVQGLGEWVDWAESVSFTFMHACMS